MPITSGDMGSDETKANHEAFLGKLRGSQSWSFWLRFFEATWAGTFDEWDLAFKVVQIENEHWEHEDGYRHIAGIIADLEEELLAEKLARAERIEKDPSDGRYTVSATVISPDDMIERSLKNLSFSLDIAMKGHNRSGFDDFCVAYQYLDHTRQNCLDDPTGVHDNYRIAREIIEDKLSKDEYRPEDGLTALVQFLERQEVQLRADHPAIREAHDRLVQQRLRELDDEKRLQLGADFEELTEETKGRLSDEFSLDSKALASDSGPEAQADALKRAGGRSQLMTLAEKGSDTAKAIDASGGWKATKIGVLLVRIGAGMSGLF